MVEVATNCNFINGHQVKDLEKQINKTIKEGNLTPKVVVTVDLFGLPADFNKVRDVADKYTLPMHPYLTDEDIDKVVKAVKEYLF